MQLLFLVVLVLVVVFVLRAIKAALATGAAARRGWRKGEDLLERLGSERDRARERGAEVHQSWERLTLEEPPPAPPEEPPAQEEASAEEIPGERTAPTTGLAPEEVLSEAREVLEQYREAARKSLTEKVPAPPALGGEPAPEAVPPELPPVGELALEDPRRLAASVFPDGRPGFEAERAFADEHRGRPVRWRATVDRVEPHGGDAALGDAPGTRLVAEVAPEGDEARHLRVEVGLPPGAADGLERGQEVEFAGRLAACDPYLRAFTVRDARLV